ncbi:MAG: RAMP superfamily CRISPR-associated protein [Acidobacteriota bacterium]
MATEYLATKVDAEEVSDPLANLPLLARDYMVTRDKRIRDCWVSHAHLFSYPTEKLRRIDSAVNPEIRLDDLPVGSFTYSVSFRLERPYISKGNCAFHLHENPLLRDKCFQLPLIPGSSWKGALRSAFYSAVLARSGKIDACSRFQARRLFGGENEQVQEWLDDDEQMKAGERKKLKELLQEKAILETNNRGCLSFYPTFFNRMQVEIINPHRRTQKKGTFPILIDAVKTGSEGCFRLLYVPFDSIDKAQKDVWARPRQDRAELVRATRFMMERGVGAKTSSGYGAMRILSERTDPPTPWKVEGLPNRGSHEAKQDGC